MVVVSPKYLVLEIRVLIFLRIMKLLIFLCLTLLCVIGISFVLCRDRV